MWRCPKCNEEVDEDFEICWNCQAAKPEHSEMLGAELRHYAESQSTEVPIPGQDEIAEIEGSYNFRTLLGHGRLIAGIGWLVVVSGLVGLLVGFVGLTGSGPASSLTAFGGLFGGLLLICSAMAMVVSGQVISCFVSIERNTRVTYEILNRNRMN